MQTFFLYFKKKRTTGLRAPASAHRMESETHLPALSSFHTAGHRWERKKYMLKYDQELTYVMIGAVEENNNRMSNLT